MTRFFVTGLALISALALAPPANASPIVNGGFETGAFEGWTVDRAEHGSLLFQAGHGHSGNEAVWFGAVGKFDDMISQTLTTTPGLSYDVTFWLSHGATDTSNGFTVSWGSTVLLDLDNVPSFGLRKYTYSVAAAGESTTLEFSGRELRDYFYLDDVSVTPLFDNLGATPIATPEPGTLTLVGLGIVSLARDRKHR